MSKVDIEREARRHALLQASATILASSVDLAPGSKGDPLIEQVDEAVSRAEMLLEEIEKRER